MAKKKMTRSNTKSAAKRTSAAKPAKAPKSASAKAGKATASKSRSKTAKATSKKVAAKKVAKKTAKAKPVRKPSKTTAKKTTTKKTTTKKAAVAKPKAKAEKVAKAPARKIKTSLDRKELTYFRQLLLEKRTELIGDLNTMSAEALKQDSANLSHYADHMADIGSDNFEQELTLGLVESERRLLQEIDAALDRIANRTYGMCEATGKPIGRARLEAKPWAKYSIEAAREMERNGNGQF